MKEGGSKKKISEKGPAYGSGLWEKEGAKSLNYEREGESEEKGGGSDGTGESEKKPTPKRESHYKKIPQKRRI